MSGPIRLYHELHQALKRWQKWGRPELVQTLALLMVGIFEARDVRLSRMAARVPLAIQEDNVAQRFRRWLKNPHVDVRVLYDPVAFSTLGALRHTRLRSQIDRTAVNQQINVLMMSVDYRKRAIPLLGQVLPHKGSSTFKERKAVLAHLDDLLPAGCQGVILGDREFGTADMMRSIRLHHWDFCLPVKGSHFIQLAPGVWSKLKDLAPQPGTHYFLTDVVFTQAQCYGPLHFALACQIGSTDPWFIGTNLIPTRRTLRDYARRFGCEEMFSDLKARGFHLDLSQLQHPDRFSRLLLAVALLYVWVLSLARRLCFTAAAKSFTARPLFQRYSRFQFARRWLAKQLTLDKSLTPDDRFCPWRLI
jgi:Transposase DDE domain